MIYICGDGERGGVAWITLRSCPAASSRPLPPSRVFLRTRVLYVYREESGTDVMYVCIVPLVFLYKGCILICIFYTTESSPQSSARHTSNTTPHFVHTKHGSTARSDVGLKRCIYLFLRKFTKKNKVIKKQAKIKQANPSLYIYSFIHTYMYTYRAQSQYS